MTQAPEISSGGATKLTWATCIATLNRHDVLMVALSLVLRQTRPPLEIVIVDASDNWEEGRKRAEALLAERPEIRLDYLTSPVRSSATQRNLAISRATADVVVMIDDDSFLFDDCAEALMAVLDADTEKEVAGVGAVMSELNPAASQASSDGILRKESGRKTLAALARMAMKTRLGRWINREVLLQSADNLFLRYDEPRARHIPESVRHLDVNTAAFMPGCGMAYRRELGLKEKFDTALRYYAAFEDLDVGYRMARHGALLRVNGARFHHFEAASGRIKRMKVIAFQLLNMIIFLKRHAVRQSDFRSAYQLMLWRRLLSEFLKDGLSGRLGFPQVRGVLVAMRHWRSVWSGDVATIDQWYPELQREILGEIR